MALERDEAPGSPILLSLKFKSVREEFAVRALEREVCESIRFFRLKFLVSKSRGFSRRVKLET